MNKVYARDTEVKEIDTIEALEFCEENHMQGKAALGKMPRSFALYYKNEIVGVVIFCNPRTKGKQKRYTTELFRLAFKKNCRVIGGASKLIKYYIKKVNPSDFFTYQTTSGENTDVYLKSGMELIEDNKTKKVVVKNGLTFETATNNRSDWFSINEVVRFGPDKLIKTDLGTIYDKDGKRVSNLNLFLDYCDYHLEEIPGDKVYEWLNPDVSFYCYKITAPKRDDKYYIGRHKINIPNATMEECLKDKYFGSGGEKFKNWVKLIDEKDLKKEILGIYKTYPESLKAEEKLIGNSYETDPNCLNTIAGGRFSPVFRNRPEIEMLKCDVHGEVKHQGGVCSTCHSQKSVNFQDCKVHGYTKHQGSMCSKCNSNKSVSTQNCNIHGKTKFQGDNCMRCNAENQIVKKDCKIHGLVNHKGNSCTLCTAQKAITKKECKEHGLVNFQGDKCTVCQSRKSVNMKECKKHGWVKHQGNVCNMCNSQKSVSERECETHGLTKFQGDNCMKCKNASLIKMKECPVHGLHKHRGNTCYACISDRRKAKKLEDEKISKNNESNSPNLFNL